MALACVHHEFNALLNNNCLINNERIDKSLVFIEDGSIFSC